MYSHESLCRAPGAARRAGLGRDVRPPSSAAPGTRHRPPLRGGAPRLTLLLISLIGAMLGARPPQAAAQSQLPPIQLTYRGGPMLSNVKVAALFWGSSWKSSSLTGYFGGFFRALFADGLFMANLAQYSTGGYTVGNGSLVATATDAQDPPAKVTDAQIQSEVRAQVAAGHLPKPDASTLYFVFTPPGVVVYDSGGSNSVDDFSGYHDYDFGSGGFAYAVIPYDDTLQDPRWMTLYASHELADAVTDPQPYLTALGWYDDNYGEVADIPPTLYTANQIGIDGLLDELDAADGTPYLVQKVWSLWANAPVAFAQ
jgi:hypothetical protein